MDQNRLRELAGAEPLPTFDAQVTIQLDQPRILKFSTNAICDFELAMDGADYTECFSQWGARASSFDPNQPGSGRPLMTFRELRAGLWAALRHQMGAGFTVEDAGRLIDHAPGEDMSAKAVYCMGKVYLGFLSLAAPPDQREALRKSMDAAIESGLTVLSNLKTSAKEAKKNGAGAGGSEGPSGGTKSESQPAVPESERTNSGG